MYFVTVTLSAPPRQILFSPLIVIITCRCGLTWVLFIAGMGMYVYHGGGHVCYLGFLKVRRNLFGVYIVIVIQEVNHEAVMLKHKKDFNEKMY